MVPGSLTPATPGKQLASACWDGVARIYDLENEVEPMELRGHTGRGCLGAVWGGHSVHPGCIQTELLVFELRGDLLQFQV